MRGWKNVGSVQHVPAKSQRKEASYREERELAVEESFHLR
jgi:hypothetical protein